ncbi:MAG: type IV pilin [Methanosarcina barkeri]|nr:type IV pilin [Methanosarcina sp. ERenArc_MAG2]
MDFKKLFKNTHAVSPVIGVILMVAITVILAAAIGSSVFGQGPAESAPQANLDIKSAGIISGSYLTAVAGVRFEHLGGEPIHFEDPLKTKVTASLNGNTSVVIKATDLGVFDVGSVKTLKLTNDGSNNAFGTLSPQLGPAPGDTINIKVIDTQTNQLICDKKIRV